MEAAKIPETFLIFYQATRHYKRQLPLSETFDP